MHDCRFLILSGNKNTASIVTIIVFLKDNSSPKNFLRKKDNLFHWILSSMGISWPFSHYYSFVTKGWKCITLWHWSNDYFRIVGLKYFNAMNVVSLKHFNIGTWGKTTILKIVFVTVFNHSLFLENRHHFTVSESLRFLWVSHICSIFSWFRSKLPHSSIITVIYWWQHVVFFWFSCFWIFIVKIMFEHLLRQTTAGPDPSYSKKKIRFRLYRIRTELWPLTMTEKTVFPDYLHKKDWAVSSPRVAEQEVTQGKTSAENGYRDWPNLVCTSTDSSAHLSLTFPLIII